MVPANAFFQRRTPAEVGQFPDGDAAPSSGHTGGRHGSRLPGQRDWTLGQAARSFPFWCITIGHLALGTALFMINTHAIAHFVAVGYEKLAASFYFGFIGFIRIGATLIWGSLSDRLGRSPTYGVATAVTALGVAGMIAMTFGAPLWLVYLTIALYGIGHSAGNPTYGSVIGDIFSGRKIGLIFGFLEISFGFGSAFGSVFAELSLRRHRHLCLVVYRLLALLRHLRPGDSPVRPLALPCESAAPVVVHFDFNESSM